MSWNHRVVRRVWPDNPEPTFEVHEVYYAEDGTPNGMTATAASPMGVTPDELASELRMMLAALDKPILEYME